MTDPQKPKRNSVYRERLCRLTRQRQERLEKVADLYLKGKSFRTVAELVGVSLAQIQRDIRLCKEQWAESTSTGIKSLASRELARLDRVEAEAWRAWERSQAKMVERAKEVTRGENGRSIKNLKRTKQGSGDPAFLQITLGCVSQRLKIIELLKPTDGDADDIVIDAVEVIVQNREEAEQMLTFEQFRDAVKNSKKEG